MNITKKSFIIKYVFFDIEKNIANKTSEVSNEIDDDFESIFDDILNTTKNVNIASEVNKVTCFFA